jgi:hypothetical protein
VPGPCPDPIDQVFHRHALRGVRLDVGQQGERRNANQPRERHHFRE